MSSTARPYFESLDVLEESGFTGFVSIAELQRTSCRAVSNEPGVYLVLAEPTETPLFLAESVGRHFKGLNPTAPIATLQSQWVRGTCVLYIGKAGDEGKAATLWSRLKQYMGFGRGLRIGHWGGRSIWQLADSDTLKVAWKPTPNKDPRAVEAGLIGFFKQRYARRPFANLQD